jgi:hypothetical protein
MTKGFRNAVIVASLVIAWMGHCYADPPTTTLSSVRLHLSTTSVDTKLTFSTTTVYGLTSLRVNFRKGKVELPSLVVDGYIAHSSGDQEVDFSSNPSISEPLRFWIGSDLVKIGEPLNILVSTGAIASLSIPPSIVTKIEKISGEFDEYSAYAQPFYLSSESSKLLKSGTPLFYCHAKYSVIPDIVFISYNRKVGKTTLLPFCLRTQKNPPTTHEINTLLKNNSVFMLGIPSD